MRYATTAFGVIAVAATLAGALVSNAAGAIIIHYPPPPESHFTARLGDMVADDAFPVRGARRSADGQLLEIEETVVRCTSARASGALFLPAEELILTYAFKGCTTQVDAGSLGTSVKVAVEARCSWSSPPPVACGC